MKKDKKRKSDLDPIDINLDLYLVKYILYIAGLWCAFEILCAYITLTYIVC